MAESEVSKISVNDPDFINLMQGIRRGERQVVIDLLTRRPALATAVGAYGESPLHIAAQHNDPFMGVMLLTHGANPEARYGTSGHTVLSWAVTCESIEFAHSLIKVGIVPDLYCAAGIGSLDLVPNFFDAQGNLVPNASKTGSTRMKSNGTKYPCPPETASEVVSDALCIAARNGMEEVVLFLLEHGADLNFRGFMGATPLHWAYYGGSRTVIDALLARGADPEAIDETIRCTPAVFRLATPARWGIESSLRKRLEADASQINRTDGLTSALHEAVRFIGLECIRVLLEFGADPKVVDRNGKTALDLAKETKLAPVIRLLEGKGDWS